MNNKEVFNYLKAASGLVVIVVFALIAAPTAVEKIIKPLVKSAAIMATGDSNLFGDTIPSPLAAVQRVLQQNSSRIQRDDIPRIVAEIVRTYRPDYNGATVNAVVDASFPLILSQIPDALTTPDVLTPILGRLIPEAIAALPVGKLPSSYPSKPMDLFNKTPTMVNNGYSAIIVGLISSVWIFFYKPNFPQEEKIRTRFSNLIIWIALVIFVISYNVYINFPAPYAQYLSISDNAKLLKATSIIVFSYIFISALFYFIVTLSLSGLPYLAGRFWVLTPWRALVLPTVTNPLGNLAHALRVVKILLKISDLLRKHFPEEAAR